MQRRRLVGWLSLAGMSIVMVGSAGCINLAANVIHAIRGEKIAPEYPHFKGKKVAIICSGEQGISNDGSSRALARYLEVALNQNGKDIEVISQDKVEKWLNGRGWDEPDYEAIGKGVGADQVLAVTLANVSLKSGPTMFRAHADITVRVYDIQRGGTTVFQRDLPDVEYPENTSLSEFDTTEDKFRKTFLVVISQRIGTLFYPHDPKALAVMDPKALN